MGILNLSHTIPVRSRQMDDILYLYKEWVGTSQDDP